MTEPTKPRGPGLNSFGLSEIPNELLRKEDVPPPGADWWDSINPFALTFDGYMRYGFDRCAKTANQAAARYRETGEIPSDLTLLRTCLFFEQRRWRHFGDEPDDTAMKYIRALVDTIRFHAH